MWDRDTLTLQASLHGHFDFITDIDISKCNRFIASAGKDAQVIIWDLKLGRIVKRLTCHSNLINRLLFVAPRVQSPLAAQAPSDQAAARAGTVATLDGFKEHGVLGEAGAPGQESTMGGGPSSQFVKDQFLLTCSDDGTVHLYDFSPLSR